MQVVLDTNVLVAAGFRPGSSSGRLVERARRGELQLVWDRPTRDETRAVLRRIPPLRWSRFEGLYRPEQEFTGPVDPAAWERVRDPADRKFAALAAATGAVLVSSDDHLLEHRGTPGVDIRTPGALERALAG